MDAIPRSWNWETEPVHPGVWANVHGGYTIHVKLDDGAPPVLSKRQTADELAPADAPTLAGLGVFEDCVALALQDGHSVLLHVSDPRMSGSVLRFYRANGVLCRVVPVEQLNGGWVSGHYVFRSDLRKFAQRIARIRHRAARPTHHRRSTFWTTDGWTEAVIWTATSLVWRVQKWQYSVLTSPQVVTANESQVRTWTAYPSDVQMFRCWQAL